MEQLIVGSYEGLIIRTSPKLMHSTLCVFWGILFGKNSSNRHSFHFRERFDWCRSVKLLKLRLFTVARPSAACCSATWRSRSATETTLGCIMPSGCGGEHAGQIHVSCLLTGPHLRISNNSIFKTKNSTALLMLTSDRPPLSGSAMIHFSKLNVLTYSCYWIPTAHRFGDNVLSTYD